MDNELGRTLKETLVKADLVGAILDIGEIGMDTLLQDGVWKEVPVLNRSCLGGERD